jgi:hypothetical protein
MIVLSKVSEKFAALEILAFHQAFLVIMNY